VTRASRLVSPLFLTAIFCATFEKVHWNVAGTIYLADVTTIAFLAVWALDRLARPGRRVPRTVAVLLSFLVAFLLVYLIGFFNLDTKEAADQFGKGLAKWLIHFVFLVVAVAYIAGRSRRYYWRTLTWFVGGMTFNALYGILQLGAAQAGHNLDSFFVKPLTRGASQINIYGAVAGSNVYRPNALTGDPNHLAIMLLVPLLVLAPIYLRLEPRQRLRLPLALLIALLLLVELATLSRSGPSRTAGCSGRAPRRYRSCSSPCPCSSSCTGASTISTRSSARASRRAAKGRRRTSASTRSSRTSCTCTRSSGWATTTFPSTTSSSRGRPTGGRTRTTSRCWSRVDWSAR
jgi:hypothetical protein